MQNRTFSAEDQAAFAKLSGDYNDLHLDALVARRSQFGEPIVHGVNALLWALDSCLQADKPRKLEIKTLKSLFIREIRVGEPVRIEFTKTESLLVRLKIIAADAPVASIKVEFCERDWSVDTKPKQGVPARLAPADPAGAAFVSAHGELDLLLDAPALKQMYPNLDACMNPQQIAIILGATRLVGMHCPGRYSLFSELELLADVSSDAPMLTYEVRSIDTRFDLLVIDIKAPNMRGLIHAFHRPAPQRQERFSNLRNLVAENEFVSQRAVVIGGSRGLGEVAAKLLVAGGADVKITYHQGRREATDLVDEITSCGGKSACFQFDVLNPDPAELKASLESWYPTHLYYFATPTISATIGGKFSIGLFHKYCAYYVTGLLDTLSVPEFNSCRNIFCPSTIFAEDPPANFGEYAAAKVASEALGIFLKKTCSGMNLYAPRLPRLATDQTVSVGGVAGAAPGPVILAELRAFQMLTA